MKLVSLAACIFPYVLPFVAMELKQMQKKMQIELAIISAT